jgi:Domain of unknown function (DUF4214)
LQFVATEEVAMPVITTYDQLKAAFPDLSPDTNLATYLTYTQSLIVQTNELLVSARAQVAAAVALGLPASYVTQLDQAIADYQLQVSILQAQIAGLAGYDPNLTVGSLLGSTTPPPPPPPSEPPPPAPPPPAPSTMGLSAPVAPLPYSGDGVRIFGDTPMLLRETDRSMPTGAAFTRPTVDSTTLVSPEVSNDILRIGDQTFATSGAAARVLYDGVINAGKGLVGEVLSGHPWGGVAVMANDAREVGNAMNETLEGTMLSISDGVKVLNGQMAYSTWIERHDTRVEQEKAKYDAMAASALAGKVPGLGWIFAPIVDALFKVTVTEQVTNSFEMQVTLGGAVPGGAKSNIVMGGNQYNWIKLGDGGSFASGGAGGNHFTVGNGRDKIVGGAGIDTVAFTSSRASYNVSKDAAGVVTVSGPDNTDTLARVERMQFADQTLALDVNGNAGMGYRLYRAAFDRAPDIGGLGWWIRSLDQGVALNDIAQNFIDSAEFSFRYGSLDTPQFVIQLYANVLDRAPDEGGLAYWQNNMNHGQSRAEVLAYFSESPENQAAVSLVLMGIQDGIVYT